MPKIKSEPFFFFHVVDDYFEGKYGYLFNATSELDIDNAFKKSIPLKPKQIKLFPQNAEFEKIIEMAMTGRQKHYPGAILPRFIKQEHS